MKKFAKFLKTYKAYVEDLKIDKKYYQLNEATPENVCYSYLVEPHALYRLNYRWIRSLKLMIFNQEK